MEDEMVVTINAEGLSLELEDDEGLFDIMEIVPSGEASTVTVKVGPGPGDYHAREPGVNVPAEEVFAAMRKLAEKHKDA
jgi:hypothetical protein